MRTGLEAGATVARQSGSSGRRKPGTPASRALRANRIHPKTTRSPRHAIRMICVCPARSSSWWRIAAAG